MQLFALALTIFGLLPSANAQSASSVGCLRLTGSLACPAFQYAYLSPSNLSNAFPFFESVTDVASFDAAALNYFSNPYQFATTKFTDQLGCSNATGATIRYERTVLCSMWVNEQWSSQCLAFYNGTSAATSQKMVCQQTCLDYSASEKAIVNSTEYCPGPDLTNGSREAQITKDFVDCTNWTTLATNDSMTCVTGEMNNDINCGFASSTQQLCDFCNNSNPDDCCYGATTNVSISCGFVLPARASSSSTSASASASTSANPSASAGASDQGSSQSSNKKLSGGQIAGIVVGSVIGGLLLLAALILLFCCCRRRKNKASQTRHQPNNSEKGLVGDRPTSSANTNSTPTFLDGNTVYAGSGHAKSAESGLLHPAAGGSSLGLAAAGAGMGAGAGAAAAYAGAERGGVVLPRVRDENQNDERFIETGAEVTVLWPYTATLPDELDLRPGMKIRVLRLYDDAWGTGQVVAGGDEAEFGRQGAFPIVCVSEGSSFGSVSHGSQESSGSH